MNDWKTTAKQMYKNKRGYKKIAARVGKTEEEIRDFLKGEKTNQETVKIKPEKFTVFENLAPATHVQEWRGWIITVEVDSKGHIQRIVPEMIPFYKGINSDYKNWSRNSSD